MDTPESMAFFASAVDDDVAIYKNQAFTDPSDPKPQATSKKDKLLQRPHRLFYRIRHVAPMCTLSDRLAVWRSG